MTDSASPLTVLYITTPNKSEAMDIVKVLLQEHLIACANITEKVIAVYRWQGELEEAHESVIIAKTRTLLVKDAIKKIRELHSYETPCILALPVIDALPAYVEWVKAETRQ